ncbi:MAG: glycosyltransferase [Desulfobacterales bacterium]|nr:glycosyltransferase [Desulfobacterales bacterium]
MKKISVIIPAHNEEKYIGKCLGSIRTAESNIDVPVEIIVSLNRCTDNTEKIAKKFKAIIVKEDKKNIAKIRNKGVNVATGDILVTIDADSWMTPNMLQEVIQKLQSEKYIGGGVRVKPERLSIGIFFSVLMVVPYMLKARISSAGMFWLYKRDFEAIGGFDESHVSVEDYYFAIKLKAYGKQKRLKYGTIRQGYIVTSCRKFDQFGDWYFFKNPNLVKEIFTGTNQKAANEFYYDVDR